MKGTQLCLTLCDPMDYIVHGILQARILECSHSLLQGIFPTQGSVRTDVSHTAGRDLHFKVPFQCISFPHSLQSSHPALLRLSASLIPAVFIDTFAQFTTGCKILFTLSISSDQHDLKQIILCLGQAAFFVGPVPENMGPLVHSLLRISRWLQ